MTRSFLLLSAEHPTLPRAEVDAILSSEDYPKRHISNFGPVSILDSPEEVYPILQQRSSMVLAAGKLLLVLRPDEGAIRKGCTKLVPELRGRASFCVRIRRFAGSHSELQRSKLEREIGSWIIESVNHGIRVDLHHPDASLLGIITPSKFVLGELKVTINRGVYDKRRPRTRPFFKPGVLAPRIARAFVNLSGLNASKTFYDPFLGTGGFLVEACLVGRYSIGSDADLRMVKGARLNLAHYDLANYDLFLADAAHIPVKRLECVSFDPPYGRATSTRRRLTEDLIMSAVREIGEVIVRRGHVVLAYPSHLEIEGKLHSEVFSVVGKHSMRVHRSLTRSILVLRRD